MSNYQMKRREFIKGCAVSAAGIGVSALSGKQAGAGEKNSPNIIYIMADDLGYGDLGCYGQKDIRTPNIDRLADEGMRFTDHYSGSTVCAPSRCCLLTGLHTGHAYIRNNRQVNKQGQAPIPAETVTIAELLKQAGYKTGTIGKWGLGYPGSVGIPNRQGFDYFYGYLCQGHAHNYYPEFLYRNNDKVPVEGTKVNPSDRYAGSGVAYERVHYSHDLMAEDALSFIERNRDNPFFFYFAPTIPHVNNEAGEEGLEVPDDAPYTNRNWPQQLKNYAAMITRLDRDVGRIMSLLKELGIDDNTIVFFTSDNGPEPPVHGFDPKFFNSSGSLRGMKTQLYEGGIRVPMIARWPGKIKAGTVTHHISANWDFFPTALEIAGASIPDNTDGLSYLPSLFGKKQAKHEFLYWEYERREATHQAVRMGKWKGIRFGAAAPMELYDLSEDQGEKNNIAGDHTDIVKKIESCMKTARTESETWELL